MITFLLQRAQEVSSNARKLTGRVAKEDIVAVGGGHVPDNVLLRKGEKMGYALARLIASLTDETIEAVSQCLEESDAR